MVPLMLTQDEDFSIITEVLPLNSAEGLWLYTILFRGNSSLFCCGIRITKKPIKTPQKLSTIKTTESARCSHALVWTSILFLLKVLRILKGLFQKFLKRSARQSLATFGCGQRPRPSFFYPMTFTISASISSPTAGTVMEPEAGALMLIMGVVTVALTWDFSKARSASSI